MKKKIELPEQENSGSSGYYASVNDSNKKEEPVEIPQENSGNSGYYASCGAPPQLSVTLTAVLPEYIPPDSNTVENNVINDPYEIISQGPMNNDDNNTYDFIANNSNDSKQNKDDSNGSTNNEKQRNYSKDRIDTSKKKIKQHHKKEKHQKTEKLEKGKLSPKHSSRFSRVNPFKHSKKRRQSDGNITDEMRIDIEMKSNSLNVNEKSASLPHDGRSSARSFIEPTQAVDAVGRSFARANADPPESNGAPPPLPSVVRLIHLTEHNKTHAISSSGGDGLSSIGIKKNFFFLPVQI